jgi:hypothetical protein
LILIFFCILKLRCNKPSTFESSHTTFHTYLGGKKHIKPSFIQICKLDRKFQSGAHSLKTSYKGTESKLYIYMINLAHLWRREHYFAPRSIIHIKESMMQCEKDANLIFPHRIKYLHIHTQHKSINSTIINKILTHGAEFEVLDTIVGGLRQVDKIICSWHVVSRVSDLQTPTFVHPNLGGSVVLVLQVVACDTHTSKLLFTHH